MHFAPCTTHPAQHRAPGTRHYAPFLAYGLVGDVQAAVDDGDGFAQFVLADAERWSGEEVVPPDEREQTVLAEEGREGGHFGRGAVERCHRLARRAVAYQFDCAEQADRADGAD